MSLTDNKNFLSPVSFKVTIDTEEFANLEYFCISATVPGITLPEINLPFRGHQNTVAGETLDYPPFDMRFIVNENLENYIELFNWIKFNSLNSEFKKKDIHLHIASSHNNIIKIGRFVDAHPVALGAFEFDSQNTDIEYVAMDATFRYSYFEFIK